MMKVTKSIDQSELPASNMFALNAHPRCALLGTWTALWPHTLF